MLCDPRIASAQSAPPRAGDLRPQAVLEEVTVTANRRAESALDVPYNISALSAEKLNQGRASSIDDLTSLVPGMTSINQGGVAQGNNNNFVVRGINANPANNNRGDFSRSAPTVGTYVNDSPVFFPFSLLDLERVEVLRGPQGTLYGSGALGGALRLITRKPDLIGGFDAEITARFGATERAGDPDYGLDAIVNAPLSDTFGVRIVGSTDYSAGYIDAVGRVQLDANGVPVPAIPGDLQSGYALLPTVHDTNDTRHTWFRTTALWQITDNFRTIALFQHDEVRQDDAQVSAARFPGGVIDMSVKQPQGARFVNDAGCPDPTVDAFGFIPIVCLGNGTVWPNGGTQYPATGRYDNLIPVEQPTKEDFNLASIEAEVDFGFATFTASSAYSWIDETYTRDSTGFLSSVSVEGALPVSSLYAYYPRLIAYDFLQQQNRRFTQELRLVSAWEKPWDYIVGGYFEKSTLDQHGDSPWPGVEEFCTSIAAGTACFAEPGYLSPNPQFGDVTYINDESLGFRDVSVYGELTYHVTGHWQITGGFRRFWERVTEDAVQTFPFCGAPCANSDLEDTNPDLFALGGVVVDQAQKVSNTIFKLNTSYEFDSGWLAYATYSEGYRRGGANRLPASGVQASAESVILFQPDFADNYEIGVKGAFNGYLNFSAAVFWVDWTKFQFQTISAAGYTFNANGNEARSRGVELEGQYQLSDGLAVDFGYAYTDAEVTKDAVILDLSEGIGSPLVPVASLRAGDSLPNVRKHTATVGFQYKREALGRALGFDLRGSYHSAAEADFPLQASHFRLDSYSLWNASVTFGSAPESWQARAYVHNLFNDDTIMGGLPAGLVGPAGQAVYVNRPRSFGVSITKRF